MSRCRFPMLFAYGVFICGFPYVFHADALQSGSIPYVNGMFLCYMVCYRCMYSGEENCTVSVLHTDDHYVFSDDEFMSILKKEGFKYSILNEFDHFRITKLNKKFLDVETRSQKVKKRYLLEVTI